MRQKNIKKKERINALVQQKNKIFYKLLHNIEETKKKQPHQQHE